MTVEVATRCDGSDTVFLEGLVREIEIGILPQEYGVLQRVRFSVWLDLSASAAPPSDHVPTVSYIDIVTVIDDVTTGRRTGLVETLVERLAARLLAYEVVETVRIKIEKMDILDGDATVGVDCVRRRAEPGSTP